MSGGRKVTILTVHPRMSGSALPAAAAGGQRGRINHGRRVQEDLCSSYLIKGLSKAWRAMFSVVLRNLDGFLLSKSCGTVLRMRRGCTSSQETFKPDFTTTTRNKHYRLTFPVASTLIKRHRSFFRRAIRMIFNRKWH